MEGRYGDNGADEGSLDITLRSASPTVGSTKPRLLPQVDHYSKSRSWPFSEPSSRPALYRHMSISPDQRSAIDARSELDGWSYYSETLVNLGAISIALWKTASDPRTGNLSVSVTRDVLQLQFDSEKRTFQLPVAVEQSYSAIVGGDHFSVRLAIKSDDLEALQRPDENLCPISTVQLSTGEWFLHCAGCGSLLVRKSEVREWLDLPSAHWAEMMDFWHCHKPREGENEEDTSSKSRGYEMAANLYPQKGRALVDVTVIYLDQNYCCGLKVSHRCQAPRTYSMSLPSCSKVSPVHGDPSTG